MFFLLDRTMMTKLSGISIGSWITLGHFSIAEIMADSGFDWLCIDMEHSVIDYYGAEQLIAAIQSKGCIPYVRVGANDPLIIKRVLDAGAKGVIVPMVNSKKEAKKAVDAVKYPPVGTRGVGLARAQGYGFNFEKFCSSDYMLNDIDFAKGKKAFFRQSSRLRPYCNNSINHFFLSV